MNDSAPKQPIPVAPAAASVTPAAEPTGSLFLKVFPSIMLPMFLAVADQTIVATALPSIASGLGDIERASWVIVSYLIANTIAAPVYGRLGDTYGRRLIMIAALAIFMAGSVFCALSPSIEILTAARVLQGFGGGGLMTLSQALIGETVPPRERGRYQGYLAGVSVTSSTFGPVAGGYLTQGFGWQSIFLVNVPLGLIAVALVLRLQTRPGDRRRTTFDTPGLLLFIMFVSPVILALEQVQRMDARALPLALGLLTFGMASLAALIWQERRNTSPLLPLTFGIGIGSMITGQLVTRTGRTAIFPTIGLAVTTLALLLLAFVIARLSLGQIPWAFGFIALCMGSVMAVVQVTVQTVAGPRMLGTGAAMVQFSRSVGAAFGTATVAAILFSVLATSDRQTAALFGAIIDQGPDAIATLPAMRQALIQSEIANAFRVAFIAIAVFTAAGTWLACSMPLRRL